MNDTSNSLTSIDIRLVYLEDRMNQLNMVLAKQAGSIDTMKASINTLGRRLVALEKQVAAGSDDTNPLIVDFTTSDHPPDGANR